MLLPQSSWPLVCCGEKWAPGHRCAAVPQLHALQEVWEMCQQDFFEEGESSASQDPDPAQLNVLLSAEAVAGNTALRTMQFSGSIADRPVFVLTDSGSSHSFISASVAEGLSGARMLDCPASVRVADGSILQCTSELPHVEWSVQGFKFHSTPRVLQLGTYDLIVGMDWLEPFYSLWPWICHAPGVPF